MSDGWEGCFQSRNESTLVTSISSHLATSSFQLILVATTSSYLVTSSLHLPSRSHKWKSVEFQHLTSERTLYDQARDVTSLCLRVDGHGQCGLHSVTRIDADLVFNMLCIVRDQLSLSWCMWHVSQLLPTYFITVSAHMVNTKFLVHPLRVMDTSVWSPGMVDTSLWSPGMIAHQNDIPTFFTTFPTDLYSVSWQIVFQ